MTLLYAVPDCLDDCIFFLTPKTAICKKSNLKDVNAKKESGEWATFPTVLRQ